MIVRAAVAADLDGARIVGFAEVDRCVDFRKPITVPALAPDEDPP